MQFDNLISSDLQHLNICPIDIQNGYFMNDCYFKEIFSFGAMHMAETAIDGLPRFMFNTEMSAIYRRETIVPKLRELARTNPNCTKYFFFKDTTKLQFGDALLNFRKLIRDENESFFKYSTKHDPNPMIDYVGKNDVGFLVWFARNYEGSITEDPIVAGVLPTMIDLCDEPMVL